jgi:hypothetical protein
MTQKEVVELIERESKALADDLVRTIGPSLSLSILASSTITVLTVLAHMHDRLDAEMKEALAQIYTSTLGLLVERATGNKPEAFVWTPGGEEEAH